MKTENEKMNKLAKINANIKCHKSTIHDINRRSIGLGGTAYDKAANQIDTLEGKIEFLKKEYDGIVATL